MRAAAAILRAHVVSALTYRTDLVLSLAGLAAMFVTTFFVTDALQPLMGRVVRAEGGQYFGFVVLGMVAVTLLQAIVVGVPGALGGAIRNGTLEAMMATPASLPSLVTGLSGYGVLWATLRAALLLAGGAMVGMQVSWERLPAMALILAMTLVPYIAIALVAAAAVLAFRTAGALPQATIIASTLLGGVYYPTRVVPGWLGHVAAVVPLGHGLRAMRRVMMEGAHLADVQVELVTLFALGTLSMVAALLLFRLALAHARRVGGLSQY